MSFIICNFMVLRGKFGLLVSSPACEELKSHYSIPTNKKLSKRDINSSARASREMRSHSKQTVASKFGETRGQTTEMKLMGKKPPVWNLHGNQYQVHQVSYQEKWQRTAKRLKRDFEETGQALPSDSYGKEWKLSDQECKTMLINVDKQTAYKNRQATQAEGPRV